MLDTTDATADDLREAMTNLARCAARLSHYSNEWLRLHEEIGHLQDELELLTSAVRGSST